MSAQPLDINALKNILGNAKAIMKKVETNDYQTGNIDARALTEDGVQQLYSEGVTRPASSQPQGAYTQEMVENSKLPDVIKQAMIKKPIPQLNNLNHTFSLNDVEELIDDKKMGLPKTPKTNIRKSTINETHQNEEIISVNMSELKQMVSTLVNGHLLEFFTKSYNEMVTENAVKKTLNMLIKEGKLQPKKKQL